MKIIDVPQSGKCGLTVSFSGRNGLIRRSWVVPSNPRTTAQMNVRTILAAQASAFSALTQDQQNTWDAAAAGYQSKSRLGQSGPLTGLQLFVKLNGAMANHGLDTVTVPTARPTFPSLAPQGLVITNAGGVVTIKLTCPADPGESTFLKAARPVNSGVRAVPTTVRIGICPTPVAGASTITGQYTAVYGVPVVGKRIFVQAYQLVDGWETLPTTFSALVPASS